MNELCLFAGAGGGSIASKWFLKWRTVCYVEIDRYCQQVLEARIRDGLLDDAPIWDDVRTFDGQPWRGCVDIVTAGFPCQPFSVAGKRKGADDERNMWPDTIRIIREVRPQYAFLENVPGLLVSGYFGHILGDLAESGYDIRWRCLSAAEVGAPHFRDRLWLYVTDSKRTEYVGYVGECRISSLWTEEKRVRSSYWNLFELVNGKVAPSKWKHTGLDIETRPLFIRNHNGTTRIMDRLKALGNGQVPQVVKVAWELLCEERL